MAYWNTLPFCTYRNTEISSLLASHAYLTRLCSLEGTLPQSVCFGFVQFCWSDKAEAIS